MSQGRSDREEDAFQSMFDAIKGQSIHAAPVNAAGEDAPPAEIILGPDGQPIAAPAVPAIPIEARERDVDDTGQQLVAGRMWLVSFCDLMSLMLCFFVLMYAMKEPNLDQITAMLGGGKGSYSGNSMTERGEAAGDQSGTTINRVEYGEALNLDYLEGILKTALNQSKLAEDVTIANGRDHLRLLVEDPFAGDAALNTEGTKIAKGLAERLNFLSNRITVVAHGGDWNEVVARSSAFAEVMREAGYRKPFTVIGELTRGADIEIRVEADDGRIR